MVFGAQGPWVPARVLAVGPQTIPNLWVRGACARVGCEVSLQRFVRAQGAFVPLRVSPSHPPQGQACSRAPDGLRRPSSHPPLGRMARRPQPPKSPLTHAVGSDRVDDIRGRRAPCHTRIEIAAHYRERSRARATIHQRGQGCSSPVRLFGAGSPARSIIRTAIHYRKRSRTRATVPQHWSQAPDPLPGVPSGQHPDRHPLPQAVEG